MEVGVAGERNAQPPGCELVAHRSLVAARVHGQGTPVAEVDEVRGVAEALVDHSDDLRDGHEASGAGEPVGGRRTILTTSRITVPPHGSSTAARCDRVPTIDQER